jgi:aryl-alcohol dehydrogenase-like predicted oxidoreductase
MDYTHLGRSGVSVSRLCLGTMNFGAITGEADALEITLDGAALGRLDKIFPGPGGAAPEAYAW